MKVGMITALHLEPSFGDDHVAAHAFYKELEWSAPNRL
jgi:hypothetical protein